MKETIVVIIIAVATLCLGLEVYYRVDLTESDLPPGYTLLQSKDGSRFALKSDTFSGGRSANVWSTKGRAIAFAREWDEFINEPFIVESDNYKWGGEDDE